MKAIQNRIRRVRGQMASLESAIGTDHVCEDIIPQLLAVKGSVDSLIRAYIETSLDGCMKHKDVETTRTLIRLLISQS